MFMTFSAAVSVREPVSLMFLMTESADFIALSRFSPVTPVDREICFMDRPIFANSFADIPSCMCQLMNMSLVPSTLMPSVAAVLSAAVCTDLCVLICLCKICSLLLSPFSALLMYPKPSFRFLIHCSSYLAAATPEEIVACLKSMKSFSMALLVSL